MNIGIHFFDLLLWLFGSAEKSTLHLYSPTRAAGVLELERAHVRWFLSIDGDDLPEECKADGKHAFRSVSLDREGFELSEGFTDLHTRVYEAVLAGRGLGIDETRPSNELVYAIRTSEVQPPGRDAHPILME